jgi:multisubunit Na+/H+ antiporter MnhC subunit
MILLATVVLLGGYLYSRKQITPQVLGLTVLMAAVFTLAVNSGISSGSIEMFDKPVLSFHLEQMGKVDTHQRAIGWKK